MDYWIYWPLEGRATNIYNTIAIPALYSLLLHTLLPSVYYSFHYPFPGNGSEHRNYKSLTELHALSLYYNTCKIFSSQPDCQLNWNSESESESELLYDWRFTANQFVLERSPLSLTTSNFIFQLKTCSYSPYVISSLKRGWVCRLQLLLVLASAVILMTTFYFLLFETPPTWSESELLYDWRFPADNFILTTRSMRLTTRNFFQLNA
jgi:hypothetical protein